MGFCRTNLFKRLESAGPAFLLSIERHILRNFVVLHALDNGLDIPLGTQGAELLDSRYDDEDPEEPPESEEDEDLTPPPPLSMNGEGGVRASDSPLPVGEGLGERAGVRAELRILIATDVLSEGQNPKPLPVRRIPKPCRGRNGITN